MSTHKHIDLICVVVIILALILTILFINGSALGVQAIVDEDAEQNSDSVYFTANDLDGSWDSSGAVTVTLSGTDGTIKGNGAYFLDGNLVISGGGKYVLSGTLSDGSIIVDAYESSKVWILLDGVEITCSDDACIRVDEADKVFLTLAEGTENTLTSGAAYSENALSDGTDGVIFAHEDLTINGSGSLSVSGGCKHGIAANDDLVITGGTITVEAVADGIHANDSLRICKADITVTAEDDGMVTAKENSYLYMESGTLRITSGDDGIHSAGDITIDGGSVTINAGDDGIHSDTNILIQGGTILIERCYEGIEAVTIEQTGGDVTLYPTDDGLNANGGSGNSMGFGGMGGGHGRFDQRTDVQDDTRQGDSDDAEENRPELPQMETPAQSDELSESENTQSTDIRQGERPDMSQMGTPPDGDENAAMADGEAMDSVSTENTETYIRISGGTLTIINDSGRDADGLDSNGDIYISGGTIFVSLVGDGSNSAIDCATESGGVCQISGGTVIACGGSSMAEGFSENSTQCSFLYNLTQTQAAGTTVTLTDAEGKVLLTHQIPCSFTSINVSCPELQQGERYTLAVGDTTEELTLSDMTSTFGSTQGMMGGRGGFGSDSSGMKRGGRGQRS